MLNLKIIVLLIGVFLMSVGYSNNHRKCSDNKIKFQPFPRNVYDEIWFSQPTLFYNQDLYSKMNPTYIMEDATDYKSIFQKNPNLDYSYQDNTDLINERIFYHDETSDYSFKRN